MSKLEEQFAAGLRMFGQGLPEPRREYRFHPVRRWLLDFAWPEQRVAVEIHGGIWRKGAHSTGWGVRRDAEKSTALTVEGWALLTFTAGDLSRRKLPESVEMVRRVIEARSGANG